MASVRLEGITCRFAGVTAVEDITLEVPDGEFWALVGPSGCGKSTILRTIAGLESATAGNLYIGNTLVNEVPARERDVAMVFQNYALYPHMSVADNLAFGLRMRRAATTTIQARVAAVAKSLNITHLLHRKPRQLSGGQQQRVALGRAIARQPQVFLLDEPLSNLDTQLRDDTRAELKQLHSQTGITTLYVTHDQIEAMTLADQIVVLDRGRIQQMGAPQSVYTQPINRMVASFLGHPPLNLFPATYNERRFHVGLQAFPCPHALQSLVQSAQGSTLDLGIRPEHVQVVSGTDSQQQAHLQVEVKLVEPLGRENLIRTTLRDQPHQVMSISTGPDFSARPGDCLTLSLDLEHLMLFDAATGDCLTHRARHH